MNANKQRINVNKMFGPARNTSDNFHKHGVSNVTITNSTTDMLPSVTLASKEGTVVHRKERGLNKMGPINQNSGGIEVMSPTSANNIILSPKMSAMQAHGKPRKNQG